MDFSSQYAFAGPSQPYSNFLPLPPLTPSHSHSATSDEFNNASPPDAFNALPQADPYPHGFDYTPGFAHHQQHHNSAFTHPPSPPSHTAAVHQQQHNPQHHHHQQHQIPSIPTKNEDNMVNLGDMPTILRSEAHPEDPTQRGGSDEDDNNLTPAQARRKQQNRAAQRAFRERKEQHVKDLKTKLADLELAQKKAADENERLKRDLHRVSTENEFLRSTSTPNPTEPTTTGLRQYRPDEVFRNTLLQDHDSTGPHHRITTSDSGERLLAVGAAWDFILGHELNRRGLVNLTAVSDYLRSRTRCDGQGPVFSENNIVEAMRNSVASGSDDLL